VEFALSLLPEYPALTMGLNSQAVVYSVGISATGLSSDRSGSRGGRIVMLLQPAASVFVCMWCWL
jgi:hypothetical protein